MFGLFSKNTTWKVTGTPPENLGTLRYSITSCRVGALPTTCWSTLPLEVRMRSSQNGATMVAAVVAGSGRLTNVEIGVVKPSTPLEPTNSVVRPGVDPANWIGNGAVKLTAQSSQPRTIGVPVITGNSNGTTRGTS